MGLGNSAYTAGDLPGAASAFRDAITAHPNAAAAYNNLANVLLAQGEALAAKEAAEKALQLAGKDQNLQSQINRTLNEINVHIANKSHRP